MQKKIKKIKTDEGWESKVLEVKRVCRVTAGGKKFKVRAVVIVGNMNGKVGVAVEKGIDIAQAVDKARKSAIKRAISVPMTETKTIPYVVEGQCGAAKVLLKPAREGMGVIAGGPIKPLLTLAGYQNISAKIIGVTKNPLINVLAAFNALEKLSKFYPAKVSLRENLLKLLNKNGANSSN